MASDTGDGDDASAAIEGWQAVLDAKSGAVYYWNTASGAVSWTPPKVGVVAELTLYDEQRDEATTAMSSLTLQAVGPAATTSGGAGAGDDHVNATGVPASAVDDDAPRLIDMSPLNGLPSASINRLAGIFFGRAGAGKVGTGAQQLESIEQLVEEHSGGLLASDAGLQSKLHKLAGSSLQAGAYRLGMHLKQLKTATPPPCVGREHLDELRDLLRRSTAAVRELGYLRDDAAAA